MKAEGSATAKQMRSPHYQHMISLPWSFTVSSHADKCVFCNSGQDCLSFKLMLLYTNCVKGTLFESSNPSAKTDNHRKNTLRQQSWETIRKAFAAWHNWIQRQQSLWVIGAERWSVTQPEKSCNNMNSAYSTLATCKWLMMGCSVVVLDVLVPWGELYVSCLKGSCC